MKKKKQYEIPHILNIYFGVPGSGKTTFASYLAKHDLKKGGQVWSNVPIKGCYKLEPKTDIGFYNIHDGRVIIDEAGIEYNSRDWKAFTSRATYFYKYHRHYNLGIDVFSQGVDDCDKIIRTLAQNVYVVKRSIIPFCITRRTIQKKIGIDDNSHQIIDEYSWKFLSRKIIFAPLVWGMFDSHIRIDFPNKNWLKW